MISLIRTDSSNHDFKKLVRDLDADLKIRDGEDHAFYAQYNGIENIRYVVMAYENQTALGCGAIKQYSDGIMEVKRMYVNPEARGNGIASVLLKELELWAAELGFGRCILETGINQHEAIGLYQKNGYSRMPNYGQYTDVSTSYCFEKVLS